MFCDFDLCIFQHQGVCRREAITINEVGMCDDCILVKLHDSEFFFLKQDQRKAYRERTGE